MRVIALHAFRTRYNRAGRNRLWQNTGVRAADPAVPLGRPPVLLRPRNGPNQGIVHTD